MHIKALGLFIERRETDSAVIKTASLLIAIVAALGVSALLIRMWGANVGEAYSALFIGGFGDFKAIIDTLIRATPLIFTGLCAAVAFRAQIWNIGGEGQFLAGAMGAYLAITLFQGIPRPLLIVLTLIFAFLAGGFVAGLSAFLKNRFNVDVIVSTVMMNYIIEFALSLLLFTVWGDPNTFYPLSPFIPEESFFPMLIAKYRLHAGIILAVLAAFFAYLLVEKTPRGYELRAMGLNPIAARFKGIHPGRTLMWVLFISGGFAALGGAVELTGLTHRLRPEISLVFGFTGIIVAMLADLHPLGVVISGFLFGGLINGSFAMQVQTGVPVSIAYAIQAIILMFVLSASVLTRYSIRRAKDVD
jgi:general nucleoside transport system permease protein